MTACSSLPPDRSHIRTEHRNAKSLQLDALPTRAFIQTMIDDHQCVISAALGAAESLARFIDELVPRMRQGGRLIYLGAGTSGRLGVLDASECPPTFQADPNQVIGIIAGGDQSLRRPSEGKEDDPNGAADELATLQLSPRDTVLGIAAGGTTPYVLGGLHIAKQSGAATALLTCAAQEPAPAACDHVICLDTGPELLTGSTRLKAGSATKLALNIISTAVFVQLGKVYSNLMVDLRASNAKLLDRALRILMELCPELSREAAAARLRETGGQLKLAIVMQRRGVDQAAAQALLEQHHGCLRPIIDVGCDCNCD